MAEKPECDHLIKVVLTGDSATGKSSLLLRFTEGAFDPELACTIGVDFKLHMVENADKTSVQLSIWDTAGQEKFQALTPSYYRDAHVVFLVYDVSERKSYENISKWLHECELYATYDNVLKVLVGNKIDLERHVSTEEAQAFAEQHNCLFAECSSKDDIGVDVIFERVINAVLDNPSLAEQTVTGTKKEKHTLELHNTDPHQPSGICSC